MPSYTPAWDDEADLDDFRFRSSADLVEWARRDRLTTWRTWPVVFHLDGAGAFRCYLKASSLCGIRHWSDDPTMLETSRAQGLSSPDGCASNWLILEHRWLPEETEVTELDAAAFLMVRRHLAAIGVNLVDAVIFDREHRYWSMHDLEAPGEHDRLL